MTDLSQYPPTLVEALAIHTFLEALWYSKKEMYLVINSNDICVRLCADGDVADLRVGRPELSTEEMRKKWIALCEEWNTRMTREEKDQVFFNSEVYRRQAQVIFALLQAGFNR